TVTNDQLALAAADRHHGVDSLDTGLQRLRHRFTCNNARSHLFDDVGFFGVDGTLAVDGHTQRVDNAAAQFGPDGHFQNTTGGFNGVAFGNAGVVTQNNRADGIALKVERQSEHVIREFKHFALHHVGQAVDAGNTVGHGYDRALRTYVGRRAQAFNSAFEQFADL